MIMKVRVLEEEDAVPEIMAAIGPKRVLRINGHSGHGKTRLAKALSTATGWRRVSLDDYLRGPEFAREIVDRVDIERMRADLESAIHAGGVIVEGILIDSIVPVAAHGDELKIYMLSLFSPDWAADERRRSRKLGMARYHRDYRPDFWADITVLKAVDWSVADPSR